MNINRMNPMQAYLAGKEMGKKEGELISRANDIHRGIKLAYEYLLISMYNANDRTEEEKKDFLTAPQFKEYYLRVAEQLLSQIEEAIKNEENFDSKDISDVHCSHDDFIRRKMKLPLRNYDGKDEVL